MRPMKRCMYLVMLVAVCRTPLKCSDADKQKAIISRLEQAVAKTNIFDLPSFAMKANAQIEEHGKLVDGTYQLLWNGPDEWKQEVIFPGYREVQIGGKGTVW